MSRLFVDLSLLRENPQFRRLWTGYAINQLGSQLTVVAVAYQVYRLTGSSLDVGLVSLVQFLPAILAPLIGGAAADAVDRRRVLIVTNVGGAACTLSLATNASMTHPALWPLFVLAAATTAFSGADNPARTAYMISEAGAGRVVQANALRTLLQQIALVAGPSLAGVLLAVVGTRVIFWVDLATFAAALAAVLSLPPRPPHDGGTRFGWRSFAEGVSYLRGRQAVLGTFVADLNATVLGMPTALFPALALTQYHAGAGAVGLLYAAPGAGSFLAALFSGWTSRVLRQGRAVLVAVGIWGLAITGFGLTHQLWTGLVLLAVAGGADVLSAVFRSSILQQETADRVRGRLSSIQTAVVQGGPRLGNGEAGLVASLTSNQLSVVSGGLGCVVGAMIIAMAMPRFLAYEQPREDSSMANR